MRANSSPQVMSNAPPEVLTGYPLLILQGWHHDVRAAVARGLTSLSRCIGPTETAEKLRFFYLDQVERCLQILE